MTLKRSSSRVALACLVLMLLSANALAATTGKIAGRATDIASNEPLVGVNISIEGTTLGGTTNPDGYFTILSVPQGTYRLRASLVGFGTIVVTDVRVIIDQTTTVGIEMSQQVIESGEVVITAERKAVQRDVSTSVASVTSEEVRALPISNVTEVATLQAGVEGGLIVRGGGADQTLFLLDGATLRDPRNNQPITAVPLSAVKEMNVERGGFNAEYGQLQAGILNVVTREGGNNSYTVNVTARYSPPGKKYFGDSPYNPNSMWLRPYLDPAVAWTGTQNGAWDPYTQRQYPLFEGWNAISERMFEAGDPNALSPAGAQRLFEWQHRKREQSDAPDYNIDFGIGGPVIPAADLNEKLGNLRFFLSYRNQRDMLLIPLTRPDYYEYVWSLRLTSDIGRGMRFDVTGTTGKSHNVAPNDVESSGSADFLRSPDRISQDFNLQPASVEARVFIDSYYSLAEVTHGSLSGLFTHVLTPSSFYEIRLEHVYRTYSTAPIDPRDTTRSYEVYPGYYTDEAPFGFDPILHTGIGSGMWMGGHTSTTRDDSRISATTLKGNFSTQLDAHNLLKAGFEFVYNDLRLNYGYISEQFPNENDVVDYHSYPYRGALYVQDKVEFEGWVANLGVRADLSQANVQWPSVDTYNKGYFGSNSASTTVPMANSKKQFELSPRLGISHPITENSKLFFNYGHFRQLPTYEEMLRQSRGTGGAMKEYGDPNLAMAKTIAYELGYDHSLGDNAYLIQLAAFYRDVSQLQGSTQYFSQRNGVNYTQSNTNDYQDIRGFELTFKKTRGPWVVGFVNYTYQSVSGGFFDRAAVSDDPTQQLLFDQTINNAPQYRSVPRPFARLNLTFFTPPELGGPGATKLLLGDWSLTLLGDWRAGDYVTWNPNLISLASPNLQRVDWYNLNLRLTKTFTFSPVQFTLLMDMTNVLNTKRLNLNAFYDGRDEQYYFESLHLPTSNAYNNIPGDDKAGDIRKEGVPYQPIEWTNLINNVTNPLAGVIYYEKSSGRYLNYVNSQWVDVDPGKLQQVLDDKAYIDMPNMTSFWFLNPRNVYFGITASLVF